MCVCVNVRENERGKQTDTSSTTNTPFDVDDDDIHPSIHPSYLKAAATMSPTESAYDSCTISCESEGSRDNAGRIYSENTLASESGKVLTPDTMSAMIRTAVARTTAAGSLMWERTKGMRRCRRVSSSAESRSVPRHAGRARGHYHRHYHHHHHHRSYLSEATAFPVERALSAWNASSLPRVWKSRPDPPEAPRHSRLRRPLSPSSTTTLSTMEAGEEEEGSNQSLVRARSSSRAAAAAVVVGSCSFLWLQFRSSKTTSSRGHFCFQAPHAHRPVASTQKESMSVFFLFLSPPPTHPSFLQSQYVYMSQDEDEQQSLQPHTHTSVIADARPRPHSPPARPGSASFRIQELACPLHNRPWSYS